MRRQRFLLSESHPPYRSLGPGRQKGSQTTRRSYWLRFSTVEGSADGWQPSLFRSMLVLERTTKSGQRAKREAPVFVSIGPFGLHQNWWGRQTGDRETFFQRTHAYDS